MAVVPVSGSNVFFLKGVPFTNDYKNTRYFEDSSSQFSYFNGRPKVHSMVECTFVQNDSKFYVSADASIDELRDVSYMMFQNAQYHNKWYYAFVTKLERKNSSTTYVYFQIDVLQTWLFNIEWKPSFVVREHCPLWNADGTPVVNTVDEGLDYGGEYHNVKVDIFNPNKGIKFLVIVLKELIHGTNAKKTQASNVGLPQALSYYILPFNMDDLPINISSGDKNIKVDDILKVLTNIYKIESFTNNIATMFITDAIGLSYTIEKGDAGYSIGFMNPDEELELVTISQGDDQLSLIFIKSVRSFSSIKENMGKVYEGYMQVKESKLLMYPYTILTIDDLQGNRRDYRNEYIYDSDINIIMKGSMGTSNLVSFTIDGYNIDQDNMFKQLMGDENAIIVSNPRDVAVITDLLSAYLQGNKNSIENQRQQIILGGVSNVGQNVLGGVASGLGRNPLGVASSGVSAITGAGQTALQLQGLEAKQKDIANIPPQLNKMGSNVSYGIGNGYTGLFVIKKQIKREYIKKLEDFFKMFGYKKHEVKIPNLHTRKNWNYVETKDCNVIGDFNTEDLREIRAIFDGGITLWHTDDIGNYDLSNEVI